MTLKKEFQLPDARGYYGPFGGKYIPETVWAPLEKIEAGFRQVMRSSAFKKELRHYLEDYAGRPTPHARLFYASPFFFRKNHSALARPTSSSRLIGISQRSLLTRSELVPSRY